jgi:hypothetical protein
LMIESRVACLGLKRWRDDMVRHVEAIDPDDAHGRIQQTHDIEIQLAQYERLEISSLLELALWKLAMIENDASSLQQETVTAAMAIEPDTDTPLESLGLRQRNRISCGADIVISNVLPFLDDL